MLDTASLITALRSRSGAAAELLRLVLLGKVTLLMDYKLGAEYRDVALRVEHREASGLSSDDVLQLISTLEEVAEPVLVLSKVRPLSPDPDDDMVLDLAMNGQADAVVKQNAKHFRAPAKRFGIAVLSPAEVLRLQMKEGGYAE